jgi:transcriptional regulator with XRE-family HTH domain
MAKKSWVDMKSDKNRMQLTIDTISKIDCLTNEYELQKAGLLERQLRLMEKDSPSYKKIRNHVRKLIVEYENRTWADTEKITERQLEESDLAEARIYMEITFYNKRKEIIRKKLKELDMTQQDLGTLLNHSKSYISELINGLSPFSMKDLLIIHKILEIDLKFLIPSWVPLDVKEKVLENIELSNNLKLKRRKVNLIH